MAYLKQAFIVYLQKSGNMNPGAYCNGLDNIEKLLAVSIDDEYSKDRCNSLYDKLQLLRRNPEQIGKNEHSVRQYASQLRQYMSFRQEEGRQLMAEVSHSGDSITDDINYHEFTNEGSESRLFHLNTILYGPPGTGKTYYSVIYAVAICEGKTVEDIQKETYNDVLTRYNELKKAGRIVFTTFHQSYGYEEFIEGIRPVTAEDDNDGKLKYEICDGLFKNICKTAQTPENEEIDHNADIWFVWLKDKGSNDLKTECFSHGEMRFEGPKEPDESFRWVYERLMKIKPGDFVISYYGKSQLIDGVGIVQDEELLYDQTKPNYRWTRKVKWLTTEKIIDVKRINNNLYLPNFKVSSMKHMKLSDLLGVIKNDGGINFQKNDKPYVFIIDEINRGNISKIFGELITLIEETKRTDEAEEMEAVLPYSGERFSVPNNVYILGTMNTADRSIALMDTALRRRFDFIEMMPQVAVLESLGIDKITIDGEEINISKMLSIINERIKCLYDREHTIGHAYFTRLQYNPSIGMLAEIFENRIIPLLQEYFYEDYEKIQLVLGDNSKPNEFKFVLDEPLHMNNLFNGDTDIDIPEKGYQIQHAAFAKIQSYKLIGSGV